MRGERRTCCFLCQEHVNNIILNRSSDFFFAFRFQCILARNILRLGVTAYLVSKNSTRYIVLKTCKNVLGPIYIYIYVIYYYYRLLVMSLVSSFIIIVNTSFSRKHETKQEHNNKNIIENKLF